MKGSWPLPLAGPDYKIGSDGWGIPLPSDDLASPTVGWKIYAMKEDKRAALRDSFVWRSAALRGLTFLS